MQIPSELQICCSKVLLLDKYVNVDYSSQEPCGIVVRFVG